MNHPKAKAPFRTLKNIGIYGVGTSNLGVVEKLCKIADPLHICVRYDGKCIDKTLFSSDRDVSYFGGEDACRNIREEVLFLSPSVRRDRPFLMEAERRGVKLSSDAELFFEGLPEYGIPPFPGMKFAVTGSDGKSTVTALAAAMLGENAVPCGNFGRSFSSLPEGVTPVCELSSFQLLPFLPRTDRAVITNITENHLNWHKDFAEYKTAKERLFLGAKERILSADAEGVADFAAKYPLFCLISARDGIAPDACRAEHLLTVKGDCILLDGEPFASLRHFKPQGIYMRENLLSAIALSLGYAEKSRVQEVIDTFEGLPHRARKIAEDGCVAWYDSSVDSTPTRTASTLKGLNRPAVVILGGRGKNLSYLPFIGALNAYAKAAVLLGENAREIAALLDRNGFPYRIASDMEDAVKTADALAENSCDILLSPASTSFDRYQNYAERGKDFCEKVNYYLQMKYKSKG